MRPASSRGEAQAPRLLRPIGYQVPAKLREAILLMEGNIEEPQAQPELASYLELAVRQVQRIFRQYVGVTPIRHYLNLRLDRGRGLVTQTGMPIMEIAAPCGFSRVEQFSRADVKRDQNAPIRDRIEGRIRFRFRDFTDHPGCRSV
ncbi:MAG TPA: helix-turn-helix domain-containing protein [Gammaproteobacteria bacterium]|jgi:AraC family carnitine catabolism transcriptional activator